MDVMFQDETKSSFKKHSQRLEIITVCGDILAEEKNLPVDLGIKVVWCVYQTLPSIRMSTVKSPPKRS